MAFIISALDSYHTLPTLEMLDSNASFFDIFSDAELWASGRGALRSILPEIKSIKRIFLPRYICPSLPIFFKNIFEIAYYDDSSFEPLRAYTPNSGKNALDESPFKADFYPQNGDAILILNYFGSSSGAKWRAWQSAHPDIITIEDHSLAPFSNWAQKSQADFCFASLRKALPIPSGAYLRARKHKPRASAIKPAQTTPEFCAEILSAMALKAAAINGVKIEESIYRKLFMRGEESLFLKTNLNRIDPYSFEILHRLNIAKLLEKNMLLIEEFFNSPLAKSLPKFTEIKPLDSNSAFAPFLAFDTFESAEAARKKMRAPHLRPAIYWSLNCKDI